MPSEPQRRSSFPPSAPARGQQWTALFLSISLTAMAGAVIWVGFMQGTHEPTASASAPPVVVTQPVTPAEGKFPVELLVMARAVSTALAPTATPSPTPVLTVATKTPELLCGPWVEIGSPCTMPQGPLPTATPLPDCPVAPLEECIWRGSLIATPVWGH